MGKHNEEANLLRGASVHELQRACWAIIEQLQDVRSRTPEERRRLAQDTLNFLRVMSFRFHAPGAPGSPELAVTRLHADVVTPFMELRHYLAREGERAARVESLTRAAEFVLGPEAHAWLHRAVCWPDGPLRPPSLQRAGRAASCDVELAACLAELEGDSRSHRDWAARVGDCYVTTWMTSVAPIAGPA
jgi:hypothetical protein